MSASLVGSEMCIRDRSAQGRKRGAPAFTTSPRDGQGGPLTSGAPPHAAAVSYTHLTLPTICSV
eukprot:1786614-Alexandrium_andersonii.AAC.1